MPKMESTSDIPGGPNLMCCCARLPHFRWRPGPRVQLRGRSIAQSSSRISRIKHRETHLVFRFHLFSSPGVPTAAPSESGLVYSVDFVLTDPPYLVGYHDRHDRSIADDVDGQWLKSAFGEGFRVLKSPRFCVSFYGWQKADEFLADWRAAGFQRDRHLADADGRDVRRFFSLHAAPLRGARVGSTALRHCRAKTKTRIVVLV